MLGFLNKPIPDWLETLSDKVPILFIVPVLFITLLPDYLIYAVFIFFFAWTNEGLLSVMLTLPIAVVILIIATGLGWGDMFSKSDEDKDRELRQF